MSINLNGNIIVLSGTCGVEEAETLVHLIQGNPHAAVDLSAAETVHTALWQVLISLSPSVVGQPADPFYRKWIMPALLVPPQDTAT